MQKIWNLKAAAIYILLSFLWCKLPSQLYSSLLLHRELIATTDSPFLRPFLPLIPLLMPLECNMSLMNVYQLLAPVCCVCVWHLRTYTPGKGLWASELVVGRGNVVRRRGCLSDRIWRIICLLKLFVPKHFLRQATIIQSLDFLALEKTSVYLERQN